MIPLTVAVTSHVAHGGRAEHTLARATDTQGRAPLASWRGRLQLIGLTMRPSLRSRAAAVYGVAPSFHFHNRLW